MINWSVTAAKYPVGFLRSNGNLLRWKIKRWTVRIFNISLQHSNASILEGIIKLPHWRWQLKGFVAHVSGEIEEKADDDFGRKPSNWGDFHHEKKN